MSAKDIIEQLPTLSSDELRELERHIRRLTGRNQPLPGTSELGLRLDHSTERLVLSGPRTISQREVEAILADFP
jgi:hypothetical protein